jgi:two-component system invasion response regulator UvrY
MTNPMPGIEPFSVLIVDECPVIRYGLRQVLATHCRCADVGEASRSEALASLRSRHWTVVILGVSPQDGGLQFIEGIRTPEGNPKILLLSPPVEPQYASKAVQAGALGYLTKEDSVPELVRGIQSVLVGKQYISSSVKLKMSNLNAGRLLHESLSKRESEVFLALGGGKRITSIAADMKLNSKTVSTYRRRILLKMGLASDADLVAYTIRHGLRN